MKIKTMVLCCMAGVIVLAMTSASNQRGQAQSKGDMPSSKIGTVSIMKVFRDCKSSAAHRSELIAEQSRIRAELEKLSTQLQAEEDGLKAFKQDSSDYLARRKEIINKQTNIKAQDDFGKEQLILKQYKWSKELYQDILLIVSELAKEKGLDLVLEKDEIDLLTLSVNEISQTIRTNKVLYSGGCIDITDEVIARLDKK
jgi:Skp family chaperone for outer membrane proteins